MKFNPKLSTRLGAILIAIKIGSVKTLNSRDWETIPDDRQSTVETIGGVVVQDFGRVEQGDRITCKAQLSAADAAILYDYWHNRTLVTVEDDAGTVYENMRVIVKKYSYVNRFTDYFNVELEFWRV